MSGIVYCGFTVNLPLFSIRQIQQTVALQHCQSDQDYEQGLRNLWKAGSDLVIVEHDIPAIQEDIDELLTCPAILCARAYLVYPVTTGLRVPKIAHCNRTAEGYDWIGSEEPWADHAGFGLTKLGKLARQEVTDWADKEGDALGSWRNLDTRVSKAFNKVGLRFHIHWPLIEHRHQ